ncbi:MAG: Vitamin K-dependent gamma-carboxylase [Labilithrix sp.]|nr:Vitamin K-dependent gamma-carboxylase [Labilithrix sp.]
MAGWLSGRARDPLAPVDIASVAAFRIGFGLLMFAAGVRFMAHGWVHDEYEVPTHFFHYWGFAWVRPWPAPGMYVHYALMTAAAGLVVVGLWYRASIIAFGLLFTYAHLVDKTNYLNHYYLVSSLSLLMAFLPLDRAASVRVWRRPDEAWSTAPGWVLLLLRAQVGCVYVFAGIAKLESDWLVHAQPLTIWLSANSDFPGIGRLFAQKWTAYAFSWAGAFFDLTVVGWLSWRRSRVLAYVALAGFHLVTGKLFQLGLFPWIMSAVATVFFDPSWPRRALERIRVLAPLRGGAALPELPRWGRLLASVFLAWHVVVPLRHWLYPGNQLWTEQGFRFAWNVMLIEKSGDLELSVVERATGRRSLVELRHYLTPYQIKMASTQPDMILELCHLVADDHARRGVPVAVYADAHVALNGRRSAPMIDPSVDLSQVAEGLGHKPWILPMPHEPPQF